MEDEFYLSGRIGNVFVPPPAPLMCVSSISHTFPLMCSGTTAIAIIRLRTF